MSDHDHRTPDERLPEEEALQALFDATAEPPQPEQLHRMARAAAQIPETAARPWWRAVARYTRAGLVAASAVAIAAVVWINASRDTPADIPRPGPVAIETTTTEPDTMAQPVPDEETVEMLALLDEVDLQELGDVEADFDISLASLDTTQPLGVLDVLFLPEDDGELDELAAAYDEVTF